MSAAELSAEVSVATDVCALSLARRMAAMLDRDPSLLHEGDPLPHGWHTLLFNLPTRQSDLRADGAAHLGVTLPDIGLPRLMLGGRQIRFPGEIPIGAALRRETRRADVQLKEGRSGRFAIVKVEHRIFVEGQGVPAVVEHQDYVLRPAATRGSNEGAAAMPASAVVAPEQAAARRTLLPDERLLFRYSAITDNPHRIHYDLAYAQQEEGYPSLVVNGSLPAMFLLEMLRQHTGREPGRFSSRNLAPMFCGQPLTLQLQEEGAGCRLWARDPQCRLTFEAHAE
jgi:3-methylfumaryl-CoA hydratase